MSIENKYSSKNNKAYEKRLLEGINSDSSSPHQKSDSKDSREKKEIKLNNMIEKKMTLLPENDDVIDEVTDDMESVDLSELS